MLNLWNDLTRDELRDLLPRSVVVLPTGATEQHGPHLATSHDSVTVTDIAIRAAETCESPVVVAPSLVFGSSHHHLPFGGTLSLSTETYYRVVTDLVDSMIAGGARRIFLLNGHGGNQELVQLVARDVALKMPAESGVSIAAASYWQVAAASLASEFAGSGMPLPGHAGQFETATMLVTKPGNVREPRATRESDPYPGEVIPGVRLETTGSWRVFDGYTDFPHKATAELGQRILDIVIPDVAAAFDALARSS